MKTARRKKAFVFLSGSAGELDWNLPILDYLSKLGFSINIIFLTRHVKKSVQNNSLLNNYIENPDSHINTYHCGGRFFEFMEKWGYLLHRINLKLRKPKVLKIFFLVADIVCRRMFLGGLPASLFAEHGDGALIFSESPSLRRPRDRWLREELSMSTFLYSPHSPHIYASNLDRKFPELKTLDAEKNYFLLMGHPADYFPVNIDSEYAAPDLEKVFLGHPKYSARWLSSRRQKASVFRANASRRSSCNILVISRGQGSYIDEGAHKELVETVTRVIYRLIPRCNILIKKHPREVASHWDHIVSQHSTAKIIEDHILDIACEVDFAITFWSSAAIDCSVLGVPVIEFYDPNKYSLQQIPSGPGFTTVYRKLGLVHAADNEDDLVRAISSLHTGDCISPIVQHAFYNDLISRSNLWEEKIEEILRAKKLL